MQKFRGNIMSIRIATLALLLISFSSFALAQMPEHLNFSAGAGFTVPMERAADSLNTGWNINFRGGATVNQHLLADLDFTYTNSRFNDATLAHFGEPDGGVGIWSLTFNPVLRLAPEASKIQPYLTAGYGLYHMSFVVTRPSTVSTLFCDAFFGFCFPATVGVNQVVESNSTYKSGANGGLGFDFPLGQRRMKFFAEARYHRMFTTHGHDVTYVPVTFGLRW